MTLQEAIQVRHSVRQYKDTAIEAEKIAQLQALIDECNREAGVHIQFVTNEPNAFSGGLAKYGKFSGVRNYLAMIGKKGSDEVIGYCGEKVVLLAQTLGLNSCWVGLTFRKQPDKYEIREGEVLNSVIALGYGATQGVQHPQKKSFDDVVKDMRSANEKMSKCANEKMNKYPDWFRAGIEAALLAPTAVNQQKFLFVLHDNNRVEAKPNYLLIGSYVHTDLGIVKYHFEVAAGKENFEWINTRVVID